MICNLKTKGSYCYPPGYFLDFLFWTRPHKYYFRHSQVKSLINQLYLLPALFTSLTACSDGVETQPFSPTPMGTVNEIRIKLPEPRDISDVSLEESLSSRRSIRDFSSKPLTLEETSQMLWAAQGLTVDWGGRTAPSAGALYPLEIYLVAGNVQTLSPGIYRYEPNNHEMIMIAVGDIREELSAASFGQPAVREGAINLVFTAVYRKTTRKYGDRGIQYVHMETGHAAQNICLQATAMDLGAVTIGAFNKDNVERILNLPKDETPLYIIPVGKKM